MGMFLGILGLFTKCQDLEDEDVKIINPDLDGIKVITDQSFRLTRTNESISIVNNLGARVQGGIEMTLVSEIAPPSVDGNQIMASTIAIQEDNIFVGYNYAGASFKGGVDIISRDGQSLSLDSQLEIENTDISMVAYLDGLLWYGGGSPTSDSVAFWDQLEVVNNVPDLTTRHRTRIGGHLSTSLAMSEDHLFVTSGATIEKGGGLHVFSRSSKSLEKYIPIKDARWVFAQGEIVSVLSANPGQLTIINSADLSVQSTCDVPGLDQAGHKSTFEIEGDKAYVASGYDGINVYDLASGEQLLNIPLPEGGDDLFANSVTINDQVGYVAAGEMVFMFRMNHDSASTSAEVIGQLELGNYQSINEVKYSEGYLAVASGLGGTKLIRVAPPSETIMIHNFDEPSDPFWWQWSSKDTLGVEINDFVEVDGRGKVIHMKGKKLDDHPQVTARYTGFAGKISAKMEGYDPEDVFINFDMKGDGRNTRVLFMIQGRDVNEDWKAWAINLYGTNPEWERHSFNLGHMNVAGYPIIHKVQSIYFIVYAGTEPDVEIMIDNLTYSTYQPD